MLTLNGKIVVKFVISGDGSVSQAKTHSSTMTGEPSSPASTSDSPPSSQPRWRYRYRQVPLPLLAPVARRTLENSDGGCPMALPSHLLIEDHHETEPHHRTRALLLSLGPGLHATTTTTKIVRRRRRPNGGGGSRSGEGTLAKAVGNRVPRQLCSNGRPRRAPPPPLVSEATS